MENNTPMLCPWCLEEVHEVGFKTFGPVGNIIAVTCKKCNKPLPIMILPPPPEQEKKSKIVIG